MTASVDNLTTTLEGSIVTLEPLRAEHGEELWAAAQAPEIWAWLAHLNVRERSRAALAALPARFEGVLRNHMIVPDVGQRDSAYFSVIDSEWPAVEANLERRLAR